MKITKEFITDLQKAVNETENIIVTLAGINLNIDNVTDNLSPQRVKQLKGLASKLRTQTWMASQYKDKITSRLGGDKICSR